MRNGRFLSKRWESITSHASNLWTYILWPLMIGECLESKDILDEKFFREGGQDRQVLYHKELLRNVSMKYYIFEFLLE